MVNKETRIGVFCAVAAQVIWGLFPIYIHLLQGYDSRALVAHRISWSFAMLISLLLLAQFIRIKFLPSLGEIRSELKKPGTFWFSVLAALLIAANWLVFIWAVLHEKKVDASLGYYICPQLVVILGVIFQGERLARIQWFGFALTSLGVLYMVRSSASMPAISLTVAFSFGLYALLKKRTQLSALSGLTLETGILFTPAILYFVFFCGFIPPADLAPSDNPTVFTNNWQLNLLLICSGLATVLPLAMYAQALKHIPLSTVGLLQFIGPTIQLLVGTRIYHEQFDRSRLVGFLIVWTGVGIYLASTRSTSNATQNAGSNPNK